MSVNSWRYYSKQDLEALSLSLSLSFSLYKSGTCTCSVLHTLLSVEQIKGHIEWLISQDDLILVFQLNFVWHILSLV